MSRHLKCRLCALRQDDGGAILIFALLIVTTVALVVGTLLTRGDGSLRATVQLRSVAGSSYAADAAANVAINDLRTGQWVGSATKPPGWGYNNDSFDGCFGRDWLDPANTGADAPTKPATDLHLDNFYPATGTQSGPTSAVVQCTPEDATGQQGSPVPVTNDNKPGNAILTLGTGGEHGLTFKTNGPNGAFRVKGGIWSNSDIYRDSNGKLQSTQYIRAHSACPLDQAVMQAPTLQCPAAIVNDPNYPSDLGSATDAPALQTPPASCSGTVTLDPGYYDDATKLNALRPSGSNTCLVHLNPGTYYLDFHNNSADPMNGYMGNTGDVWTIDSNMTVVGGTLTSDPSVPGRCISPIFDDTPNHGVQIILGGDSRISVDHGGSVELCGSYHADVPPIAVYGQKTGTTAAPTNANGLVGSALAMSPAGSFIRGDSGTTAPTAGDVASVGGNVASFKKTTGQNGVDTATLTVSGYAPTTAIPKGSILTAATARVAYGTQPQATTNLLVQGNDGSALQSISLPVQGSSTSYPVDAENLASKAGFAQLQRYVHDNGLSAANPLQLGFVASPKSANDITYLDSLQLDLTYIKPQLRGQTVAAIPGNTVATAGGAYAISAQGNTSLFYTQGTTYLPLSSVYLALNNISESVFRFGVIARALNLFETASFTFPDAVVELPDNSPGWGFNGTLMQLKVYLCPGKSTCTADSGALAVTSRVQIWDPSGTPAPPGRQVTVLSWSHSN